MAKKRKSLPKKLVKKLKTTARGVLRAVKDEEIKTLRDEEIRTIQVAASRLGGRGRVIGDLSRVDPDTTDPATFDKD